MIQIDRTRTPADLLGKINKLFYQQLCLLEMASVRDPKQTVAGILKDAGAGVSVTRFARYQLGE